jgi:hypothetical protein
LESTLSKYIWGVSEKKTNIYFPFKMANTELKITMKNTDNQRVKWCYMLSTLNLIKLVAIVMFFGLSTPVIAQQEASSTKIGIHAGLNSGILSGGAGPSFSLHYAARTEKVVQLESMLFFDSHSGKTFLSGHNQKNLGIGVVGGVRINVFPQKNWNPSLVIMPGIMYSSQTTSRYDDRGSSGMSGAISLGIANTFYRKHMVSLGLNGGANITSLYLKYGLWF